MEELHVRVGVPQHDEPAVPERQSAHVVLPAVIYAAGALPGAVAPKLVEHAHLPREVGTVVVNAVALDGEKRRLERRRCYPLAYAARDVEQKERVALLAHHVGLAVIVKRQLVHDPVFSGLGRAAGGELLSSGLFQSPLVGMVHIRAAQRGERAALQNLKIVYKQREERTPRLARRDVAAEQHGAVPLPLHEQDVLLVLPAVDALPAHAEGALSPAALYAPEAVLIAVQRFVRRREHERGPRAPRAVRDPVGEGIAQKGFNLYGARHRNTSLFPADRAGKPPGPAFTSF